MNAGGLRHRVTIERASESRGGTGQVSTTYTPVATVWAAIEPLQGREFFDAQRVAAEVTTRIRMRHRAGVTPKMRIATADGRVFDILAVIDPENRHRELQLMSKESV